MGMQRPRDVYSFSTLGSSLDDLQIGSQTLSYVIVIFTSTRVTDPGMGTASTGIHPKDVFESEIFFQGNVEDTNGDGNETPTLVADICFSATRADIVVIS